MLRREVVVGEERLAGDTPRKANTGEEKDLRAEASALKELAADLTLEHRLLRKHERSACTGLHPGA